MYRLPGLRDFLTVGVHGHALKDRAYEEGGQDNPQSQATYPELVQGGKSLLQRHC